MSYSELDEKVKTRTGKTLVSLVKDGIGEDEWDEELFRENIESALEKGRFIQMIIVDEITDDLSRIVRFVNACGNPAFSFSALEMRRFQSGNAEMLVPRIVGDTRSADKVTRASERKKWSMEGFFEDAKNKMDAGEIAVTRKIYKFTKENASEVRMGTGSVSGSFIFVLEKKGNTGSLFAVYSNGNFTINLGSLVNICSQEEIDDFRDQLAKTPSFSAIGISEKYYFTLKIDVAFSKPEYIDQLRDAVLDIKKTIG
jgi:hypothetical protein